MSELSQVERTAMESVESPVPWCLLSTKEQHIVQEHWLAARDYRREREGELRKAWKENLETLRSEYRQISEKIEERERALEAALEEIATGFSWDNQKEGCLTASAMVEVAEAALEASQPEVLSERIEWWDDPARNARLYRHIYCDEGNQHWIVPLDDCPAPTSVDRECARCGLVVPLVARDIQPDHGPGEPSENTGQPHAICGVVCACGPNGEPMGCGYEKGHEGAHSWASLPTWTDRWRIVHQPHRDPKKSSLAIEGPPCGSQVVYGVTMDRGIPAHERVREIQREGESNG